MVPILAYSLFACLVSMLAYSLSCLCCTYLVFFACIPTQENYHCEKANLFRSILLHEIPVFLSVLVLCLTTFLQTSCCTSQSIYNGQKYGVQLTQVSLFFMVAFLYQSFYTQISTQLTQRNSANTQFTQLLSLVCLSKLIVYPSTYLLNLLSASYTIKQLLCLPNVFQQGRSRHISSTFSECEVE